MEFEYYIDTKYTIWATDKYTIIAESEQEALEIMGDIFENGDTRGFCYDFEYNYETAEEMKVKDNYGESTKELSDGNGNLIITNKNTQDVETPQ